MGCPGVPEATCPEEAPRPGGQVTCQAPVVFSQTSCLSCGILSLARTSADQSPQASRPTTAIPVRAAGRAGFANEPHGVLSSGERRLPQASTFGPESTSREGFADQVPLAAVTHEMSKKATSRPLRGEPARPCPSLSHTPPVASPLHAGAGGGAQSLTPVPIACRCSVVGDVSLPGLAGVWAPETDLSWVVQQVHPMKQPLQR